MYCLYTVHTLLDELLELRILDIIQLAYLACAVGISSMSHSMYSNFDNLVYNNVFANSFSLENVKNAVLYATTQQLYLLHFQS